MSEQQGSEPLDVQVNLLWLRPGRVGGTETYALNLLRALAPRRGPNLHVSVVANQPTVAAHEWIPRLFETEVVKVAGGRIGRVANEWHRWGRNRPTEPQGDRRWRRVVHHLGAAVAGPLPKLRRDLSDRPATVVTVFDTQFVNLPENFTITRRHYLQQSVSTALAASDAVTTATHWAKESIERHFVKQLLPPDRRIGRDRSEPLGGWRRAAGQVLGGRLPTVHLAPTELGPKEVLVVPPAVSRESHGPEPSGVSTQLSRPQGVPDSPFVVYPAVTWAHKRHELLVDVAEEMAAGPGKPGSTVPYFVLCGADGPAASGLRDRIAQSPQHERFILPGRVSSQELSWLYAHAVALVFPSAYEGLGQPPLEAMLWGCPVVAAGGTAVDEVVGDAALVVGDSVGGWAAALADLMENPRRRDELIALGNARVKQFDEHAAAEAQLAAYWAAVRRREALAGNP